jgi:hypothetical protein
VKAHFKLTQLGLRLVDPPACLKVCSVVAFKDTPNLAGRV